MNADEIEACNAQFFAGPISGPQLEQMCQSCAELSYITLHVGDKCRDCGRDMTAKENLPQLCDRCYRVLEEYGHWLQTLQSGDDEDSTTFQRLCKHIDLSESSLSANCKMCKALKLEGKPYRKPVITPERLPIQFAPLGINILGTPYSITHSERSLCTYSPLVSWTEIRSWVAVCDACSGHPATELQFQTLLSLDPWLIDVDDRRLVSMSEAKDIVYAALSYVWGGPQLMLLKENIERMREAGALDRSNACSQTIRDAILVCRRTGVRYLWVSCIKKGIMGI
jgi:hypothetical protein